MPEELVIRHCSPTLAGLKTANMFTCSYDRESELREDIRELNKLLGTKGMRVLPLRYRNGKALIYIYRPSKLRSDLENDAACRVLENCGYSCKSPGKCIAELIRRLRVSDDFPHEIGLFLGYPPEDVSGFIEKRECRLTGFWKVYGDAEKAKKKFDQYRKCMQVYYNCWSGGFPIERLAVSE